MNVWPCLELDDTFGPPGELALYVDQVLAVRSTAGDPSPSFSELSLPIHRSTASGATVATDDVVLAAQHVGCD